VRGSRGQPAGHGTRKEALGGELAGIPSQETTTFSLRRKGAAMKIICIPIEENRGIQSPLSRTFAASPMFLLVDADSLAYLAIPNSTQRQRDRGCDPCDILGDLNIDVVIADEIEASTLVRIARREIPVFGGARGTVRSALADLMGGRLAVLPAGDGGASAARAV